MCDPFYNANVVVVVVVARDEAASFPFMPVSAAEELRSFFCLCADSLAAPRLQLLGQFFCNLYKLSLTFSPLLWRAMSPTIARMPFASYDDDGTKSL